MSQQVTLSLLLRPLLQHHVKAADSGVSETGGLVAYELVLFMSSDGDERRRDTNVFVGMLLGEFGSMVMPSESVLGCVSLIIRSAHFNQLADNYLR
jgi:hypothetical protein